VKLEKIWKAGTRERHWEWRKDLKRTATYSVLNVGSAGPTLQLGTKVKWRSMSTPSIFLPSRLPNPFPLFRFYARTSLMTWPWTSVRRKSRPA
jgi:hypothetical protein